MPQSHGGRRSERTNRTESGKYCAADCQRKINWSDRDSRPSREDLNQLAAAADCAEHGCRRACIKAAEPLHLTVGHRPEHGLLRFVEGTSTEIMEYATSDLLTSLAIISLSFFFAGSPSLSF